MASSSEFAERTFIRLELDDGGDRSEYFFPSNLHRRGDIGKDSRFDKESFVAVSGATGLDCGALRLSRIDVSENTLEIEIESVHGTTKT